jgi:hypothetical protein
MDDSDAVDGLEGVVLLYCRRVPKRRPSDVFGSSVEDREVNDEMITLGKSGFNARCC